MRTTEIIDDQEIEIHWNEILEILEHHDSGCKEALILGDGSNGKQYQALGWLQDGEIVDLQTDPDIEEVI